MAAVGRVQAAARRGGARGGAAPIREAFHNFTAPCFQVVLNSSLNSYYIKTS